ncbi:hypothetical protein OROGR_025244 [Orobanche gracilis]
MEKQGKAHHHHHHQVPQSNNCNQSSDEDLSELRRGPWTVEEDFSLINYIAHHGEGRWNSLARSAGLKRTGKSCRLRWLNYLRPDVRRGNITLEEQLLILELHSRWGNRWSKIAQHLPGRTDNEIKNYWRTRVQKHAKQLKCDVNSKQFKEAMRYLWMPRLVERIQAATASGGSSGNPPPPLAPSSAATTTANYQSNNNNFDTMDIFGTLTDQNYIMIDQTTVGGRSGNSSADASLDSLGALVSDLAECCNNYPIKQGNNNNNQDYYPTTQFPRDHHQPLTSPSGYFDLESLDFMEQNSQWMDGGYMLDSLLNVDDDDTWSLEQKLNSGHFLN